MKISHHCKTESAKHDGRHAPQCIQQKAQYVYPTLVAHPMHIHAQRYRQPDKHCEKSRAKCEVKRTYNGIEYAAAFAKIKATLRLLRNHFPRKSVPAFLY